MTERYVAIDNIGAWPNLTLMPDGEIAAVVFNQPCHGTWEGESECWVCRLPMNREPTGAMPPPGCLQTATSLR